MMMLLYHITATNQGGCTHEGGGGSAVNPEENNFTVL